MICSDILLPSHAPPEFTDRQTLWNAVEKAERGTVSYTHLWDRERERDFMKELKPRIHENGMDYVLVGDYAPG